MALNQPVAVLGRGNTCTARLLEKLIPNPVVELTPCAAVMDDNSRYRAVVVENFEPIYSGLTPCGAARWELSRRADILVVGLDEEQGRRFVQDRSMPVYAYSDGRPQADLTAKHVRLGHRGLEFEALTDRELRSVRVPLIYGPRLYDALAALAGALALGVPLSLAVSRLAMA